MLRKFVHEHTTALAYTAVGVLLFFASLLATFPYADTLTGVLAPMGLRLTMRDQGLSFPFGIRMDGVMLDLSLIHIWHGQMEIGRASCRERV